MLAVIGCYVVNSTMPCAICRIIHFVNGGDFLSDTAIHIELHIQTLSLIVLFVTKKKKKNIVTMAENLSAILITLIN